MRDDRNHTDDGLGAFLGLLLCILLIAVLDSFAKLTVEDGE